jgi:uncharacterized membrane protein YfcA
MKSCPQTPSIGAVLLIIILVVGPVILQRGVSARLEAGIGALMLFCGGVFILMRRRGYVRQLIAQSKVRQHPHTPWLGRISVPYKWAPTFFGALMGFAGIVFIIGGSLMLYTFVTGRDWPLHHAKWSDLWPF